MILDATLLKTQHLKISIVYFTYTYSYTVKYECKYRRTLSFQVRTVLLTSNFGSSTLGERHNSYHANHSKRAAHLVLFKISVGKDSKNPTTSSTAQIQLYASTAGTQLSVSMVQSQHLNWLFFKILKFSGPSLPGMTSSIFQPHFLSGVYYDNGDCHILIARA